MTSNRQTNRLIRSAAVIVGAVAMIIGVYAMTGAGSTQPPNTPTVETYRDVSSIYDAIASTAYDSSSVAADANGSAFEIAKCIISRISGGPCP